LNFLSGKNRKSEYTPEDQVNSHFNEIEKELNEQIEALIAKEVQ